MIYSTMRNAGCIILLFLILNCSGESTSSYSRTVTEHSKNQVVSGMLYGYGAKIPVRITGAAASPQNDYFSLSSGKYAIADYPAEPAPKEHIFSAEFSDGTLLYSVWSGTPTASASIERVYDQPNAAPSDIKVTPDNSGTDATEAIININPLTDLSYWYWLHEDKKSTYYSYLTDVFYFFRDFSSGYFNEMNYLPPRDLVKGYPSPELMKTLAAIEIKTDALGFTILERASGKELCKVDFGPILRCKIN